MSVARSALVRGPGIVAWNSITMYSRTDVLVKLAPVFRPVVTSMYNEVDMMKADLMVKVPITLWGAWESVSTLFPTALLAPTIGASLYGTTDLPLTITARNGDKVTVVNAQITKLANLYLGVDSDLFAADVEFTGLVANNANPEDSNSYFTTAVSQTFTETTFAKTNFKRVRFTGAWGSVVGFTAIIPQKGFQVALVPDLKPVTVDGLGTIDMTIAGLMGSAKCIPIQPTMAQSKTNSYIETAHGVLQGTNSADLVLTGASSGPVITLKNAAMNEHALAFGIEPLRAGEMAWNTTRGFTTGAPQAVATAS